MLPGFLPHPWGDVWGWRIGCKPMLLPPHSWSRFTPRGADSQRRLVWKGLGMFSCSTLFPYLEDAIWAQWKRLKRWGSFFLVLKKFILSVLLPFVSCWWDNVCVIWEEHMGTTWCNSNTSLFLEYPAWRKNSNMIIDSSLPALLLENDSYFTLFIYIA